MSTNLVINNVNILAIIVCLVIIIATVIYFYIKGKNGSTDFDKFLVNLKVEITNCISDTIDKYMDTHDISNMKLDELEKDLLENIFNVVFEYMKKELVEDFESTGDLMYKALSEIIEKSVTQDKIKKYIETIINSNEDIQDKIMDLYNIAYKDEALRVEKEDKEMTDLYDKVLVQDTTIPYTLIEDEEPVKELDPTVVVDPEIGDPKEEEIIPQEEKEDDDAIKIDDTVELL